MEYVAPSVLAVEDAAPDASPQAAPEAAPQDLPSLPDFEDPPGELEEQRLEVVAPVEQAGANKQSRIDALRADDDIIHIRCTCADQGPDPRVAKRIIQTEVLRRLTVWLFDTDCLHTSTN